jgi:signal peptidase I
LDWAFHIGIAVLIGLFIVNFVVQRTIVNGNSMLPTLQDKNQLLIEKVSQRFGGLHRGDIVTIYVPEYLEEGKDYIIKRVIGIENDTVEIKDGKVYLNGTALQEDYINGTVTLPVNPKYDKITVPKGYVYVLGDNRLPNASKDSRTIGPVSLDRVRGKVLIRYYPFNEMGTL